MFSIAMFSSVLTKLFLRSHLALLLFDLLPKVMSCLEKRAGGPLEVFILTRLSLDNIYIGFSDVCPVTSSTCIQRLNGL